MLSREITIRLVLVLVNRFGKYVGDRKLEPLILNPPSWQQHLAFMRIILLLQCLIIVFTLILVKGKEGPTNSELLDEAIATAMEQTVGLNLPTLVPLFAEKIATGTSPGG